MAISLGVLGALQVAWLSARADAPRVRDAVDVPALSPGAAPLGTTDYPIPENAFFVAPTGDDSAMGTVDAPWHTLTKAVGAVPDGATVVLRAGIYREGVTISNKRVTLQPYPSEAVTLRGSQVVSGWKKLGPVWVRSGWSYRFPRNAPAQLMRPNAPLADSPDMVFVDGQQLRQVASAAAVKGKTFAVNYKTKQLTIGVNPSGHVVEGATLWSGLTLVNAPRSIVRGLQFDQFGSPYNTGGAVRDLSDGVTFENDIFTDNAMAGLMLMGTNTSVLHDSAARNGQLGMKLYRAANVTLQANRLSENNVELFNQSQEAGGVKISTSHDVTVDGNLVDHNTGIGIWFDVAATRGVVVHNDVNGNTANGVQYEISSTGIIAGNAVWSNNGGGIRVIESSDVDVWNNVSYRNFAALEVFEGHRPQLVSSVTFANNVLMDSAAPPAKSTLLDVDDKTKHRSGADMGVTTDGNAYCRTVPTNGRVADWSVAGAAQTTFTTLSAFTAATANDVHGVSCDAALAREMFVDASHGDFRLAPASVARGAGLPLPPAVAAALGVPGGSAVDIGIA